MTGATILVMDPDVDSRVILRMALERAGHRVLVAADAATALAVAAGERIEGIVGELYIMASPGTSAVRSVCAGERTAPFVLGYTAYLSRGDAEWAAIQGYESVLPKPTGLMTILGEIDRLLALHRGASHDEDAPFAGSPAQEADVARPREPGARGAVTPPSIGAVAVRAPRSSLRGWAAR